MSSDIDNTRQLFRIILYNNIIRQILEKTSSEIFELLSALRSAYRNCVSDTLRNNLIFLQLHSNHLFLRDW